ncbi:hypothetical protein BCR36DRAFT_409589 [Piromyces finnis]|uniref:Uncharacterized protein n=1 Tax=Piromyces finnis TaxID=1754191 RepID=A0A1Y1VKG2_9FUNG|nr:hypothetical protein BCR36DRAFT_409589 [Piromyces finnis]|eukprot:ORX57280.1 hypothetical protein BCR36DRAFT_409589 [Piromyces finnis]
MLSKEKFLNNISDNNNLNIKKVTETSTNNRKLYDIDDLFYNNDSSGSNSLTLNTLKKFKTFKEYKESLENTTIIIPKTVSKKKDLHNDKSKISDLSMSNLNLKIEKWDKNSNSNRKNALQDLQNTREQFLKEKHKSYHKLRIPNFGYPNIKKVTKSTALAKSNPKKSSSDSNNSNYVENLKKEALSIAERMKKIDENASESIKKRFEKITGGSLEKSKTSPNNDNFNKLIMKELKNNRSIKRENSKYDILRTETVLNKNYQSKTKKNSKSSGNINKVKSESEDKEKIEVKSENAQVIKKEDEYLEKSTDKEEINDKEELNKKNIDKNKTEKLYNKEDLNALVDNMTVNISSPITYSKNIIEKSKQIKEKRRKEKEKVIEKLNEMKKVQEERIQNIEKESSEWKKTISDIEKQLASLKDSISNTDGLFSNLFKKGKKLELEIDSIKKKNMEFEKSHYKHIDNEDTNAYDEDKDDSSNPAYEYFNGTIYDNDFTLPKTDSNDAQIVTQKKIVN